MTLKLCMSWYWQLSDLTALLVDRILKVTQLITIETRIYVMELCWFEARVLLFLWHTCLIYRLLIYMPYYFVLAIKQTIVWCIIQYYTPLLLGACSKLRTATISCNISVRLPACLLFCQSAWNNSAPTGWIFIKFNIWVFF